ncbi:MAG: hypothetical protein HC828_04875 [Blastochloris sp.]|nr:hypothetical protein [Blastochloris sp.]
MGCYAGALAQQTGAASTTPVHQSLCYPMGLSALATRQSGAGAAAVATIGAVWPGSGVGTGLAIAAESVIFLDRCCDFYWCPGMVRVPVELFWP